MTRGSTGEEEEGAGEEDRVTEQGMEMELPSEEETGSECGMFTWRGWKSSVWGKNQDLPLVSRESMFLFLRSWTQLIKKTTVTARNNWTESVPNAYGVWVGKPRAR